MILGFINEVIQKCNNKDFQDFIVESLLKNNLFLKNCILTEIS